MVSREVDPAVLRRHLGLPLGVEPDEAARPIIADVRQWYRQHGDPWTEVTVRAIDSIDAGRVKLCNGVEFTSQVLAEGLRGGGAESLAIVAVTAGKAVDAEVDRRWQDDRPDEAMFLSAYAGALVEELRDHEITRLRRVCKAEGKGTLPHYSPGYEGWDLADQQTLFACLARRGPLEILPSCFLRPVRTALAVAAITCQQDIGDQPGYWFFHQTADAKRAGVVTSGVETRGVESNGVEPRQYAFPERTLAKWSRDRLEVHESDSGYQTRFRFDGTTCSSMGMPLAIEYNVDLKREQTGRYRIVASSSAPCEGDTGHRDMCAYRSAPERFMATIASEQPLLDEYLDDVFHWQPDVNPAGCLCLQSNRDHKWRIVLQTIHFALAGRAASR
ncbi:MAG: hypothetical protein WBF93_03395 [Pirellulales bacterium]